MTKELPEPKKPLPFTNCKACAYSYMEPDGEPRLICGHPDSGSMGKYLLGRLTTPQPLEHCEGKKFEQHEQRTRDGNLKP